LGSYLETVTGGALPKSCIEWGVSIYGGDWSKQEREKVKNEVSMLSPSFKLRALSHEASHVSLMEKTGHLEHLKINLGTGEGVATFKPPPSEAYLEQLWDYCMINGGGRGGTGTSMSLNTLRMAFKSMLEKTGLLDGVQHGGPHSSSAVACWRFFASIGEAQGPEYELSKEEVDGIWARALAILAGILQVGMAGNRIRELEPELIRHNTAQAECSGKVPRCVGFMQHAFRVSEGCKVIRASLTSPGSGALKSIGKYGLELHLRHSSPCVQL